MQNLEVHVRIRRILLDTPLRPLPCDIKMESLMLFYPLDRKTAMRALYCLAAEIDTVIVLPRKNSLTRSSTTKTTLYIKYIELLM